MLSNFARKSCLFDVKFSSLCISKAFKSKRGSSAANTENTTAPIDPIIDKTELDSISPEDERHYKQALYKVKLIQVEKYNKAKESERAEIETNPQKIFLTALDNVKPLLKVIPLVKSGISYQVPVPMTEKEREFKASKLLIETCLDKERSMRFYDRLAIELIDAYQNQGKAIKKKIEIHKLAEANRAYAHFRWT